MYYPWETLSRYSHTINLFTVYPMQRKQMCCIIWTYERVIFWYEKINDEYGTVTAIVNHERWDIFKNQSFLLCHFLLCFLCIIATSRKYILKSILYFARLYILFDQSFIFTAICTNRVSVNSACFIFEKESNIAGQQSLMEKSRNLEP